jgi:molybdenum cofactor biosynthesis protein B
MTSGVTVATRPSGLTVNSRATCPPPVTSAGSGGTGPLRRRAGVNASGVERACINAHAARIDNVAGWIGTRTSLAQSPNGGRSWPLFGGQRHPVECRSMSHIEHKAHAPKSIGCFVVTVSDTRTEETDTGGRAIRELLNAAGHKVVGRTIVRDDPELVRETIERQLANLDVQVIITTGGTGITSRDSTYEAVSALLQKKLDGFGELFRMLSYGEIGPAAMLSRACAGLVDGRIVAALPGSEGAVRLAMERLLIPELGHLVREASR